MRCMDLYDAQLIDTRQNPDTATQNNAQPAQGLFFMTDDPRCCGTGTCLINADGLCWCGQQWDGEAMAFVPAQKTAAAEVRTAVGPPEFEIAKS